MYDPAAGQCRMVPGVAGSGIEFAGLKPAGSRPAARGEAGDAGPCRIKPDDDNDIK